MNFWQDLINTSLLGTGRKPLDPAFLPDELRPAVSPTAPADPEAQLLKTSALATQYVRAGTGAQSLVLPSLPVCAPETAAYSPAEANRLLSTLLAEESPCGPLLEYWLDKCRAKGWIVPPDYLVRVLAAGAEKKYQHLQSNIRPVVGKRGLWLASRHEAWEYVLQSDADLELLWQEGRPAQRKEAFSALRERDPALALSWLEQSWSGESAKDRKDFLERLKSKLNPGDETFLTGCREEVLGLGSKAKAVHQEIKALTTQLLLSLPGSALSRQVWERVRPYFQQSRKFFSLSGGQHISLVLPGGEDTFFNVSIMHGQFGFDKSSPLPGYTDAQYWLSELIRCIPPLRWQEHFGTDAAGALALFNGAGEGFRKSKEKAAHPLFIRSLADAIYCHQDSAWAAAWLKLYPQGVPDETRPQVHQLCALLPPAELEQFIMAHIRQPAELADLLTSPQRPAWSLSFTHYVLQRVHQSAHEYYLLQPNQNFLEKAIRHIPGEILHELGRYQPVPAGGEHAQRQWTDRIETPLIHRLHLRQAIDQL
jgi:hypothetical protein